MYSRALIALAVAFATACGSGDVKQPTVNGPKGDSDITTCSPDASNSLTSTYPGVLGEVLSDTFCPKGDQDFWLFTGVGGPGKLLNVNFVYNKISPIELEVDVWGPLGRCMPNALTPCTVMADCPSALSQCDTSRGGCRSPTADVCYDNNGCASGEQCYSPTTGYEQIGKFFIPANPGAFEHKLNANFPAFKNGNYVVVVLDHAGATADNTTQYQLTVTELTDPDVNEPNDLKNQATSVQSMTSVTGLMSYVGDVDWFMINPLTPLDPANGPAIIKVDLEYLSSSAIAPTWTIVQGDGTYVGPSPKRSGQGATEMIVQSDAAVNVGTGPIYVQVQNSNQNTNINDTYKLTVELTQDLDEKNQRNDVVTSATPINSSGTLSNKHLVASNDFDWYKLTRPTGSTTNSLVEIECKAQDPQNAPYSLTVQYWTEVTTTPNTCNPTAANTGCAKGAPCTGTGKCLELLVQRPDPVDAHGNRQLGGRSPNYLHTQLPIFNTNNVWVRVANDPSTLLPIPGYDNESKYPYTVTFTFKDELDPGDRDTPDNTFVAQPKVTDMTGVGMQTFKPNYSAATRSQTAVVVVVPALPATPPDNLGSTYGSATGYISYDGDQDFFRWQPDAALGPGGLKITISYGSDTEVDLRATVMRGDNNYTVTSASAQVSDNDFCVANADCANHPELCCHGAHATCNAERATCSEKAIAFPIVVPTGGVGCSHTEVKDADPITGKPPLPITLWVNDVDSNDWDVGENNENHAYTITWEYVPGCQGPGDGCPASAGDTCNDGRK